ncbi:MAG: BMP family protein [Nitrospinota bacterium]
MKRFFLGMTAAVFLFAAIMGGQAWAQKRLALVMPTAINDNGFSQSAYSGLKRIRESLGVKTAYSDNTPTTKFVSTLSNYAAQGFDVVVGHGFEFGDPIMRIAKKYPKTKFFAVAGMVNVDGKVPNVVSLQPATHEGAYVAGAFAGLITKKNSIGILGGFPFPAIVVQLEAFREGVKATNPSAKSVIVYISTISDVAKGKEAAMALISVGADVVYHVAGSAGNGVLQAAQQRGVMAIGWGMDQRVQAPKAVVASHLVDWGGTWLNVASAYFKTGKFTPGVIVLPMKTGVTDLSEIHGPFPQSVKDKVMRIRQDVIDGKIKVPFIPKPRPN